MASPRIISGSAKGLRLKSVPGDSTRPITDRVKEALFNIIGSDILDAAFLDLFGGTGSVGIEALSRGAALATFIEKNRNAYQTLKSNIEYCKVDQKAQIFMEDAFHFLQKKNTQGFDYIFIAPPQYMGLWEKALILIDKNLSLFKEDSWIIVQIHPVENKDVALEHLELFDQRMYGSTVLLFYQMKLGDGLDG